MRINLITPMSDDKERERHTKAAIDAIEQYTEERMADEYGKIHTDGSRSGGQPTVATQKAHTMVLEVLAEWGIAVRNATAQQLAVATTEALCRALDQLEDLRQPTRVMTLEGVEAETQKLVEEASTQSGMTISEWVSARLKLAATQALSAATQSDALREALELCLGELFAPEANCSCHICPPCNDCVEYSSIREAIAAGRAALQGHAHTTQSDALAKCLAALDDEEVVHAIDCNKVEQRATWDDALRMCRQRITAALQGHAQPTQSEDLREAAAERIYQEARRLTRANDVDNCPESYGQSALNWVRNHRHELATAALQEQSE